MLYPVIVNVVVSDHLFSIQVKYVKGFGKVSSPNEVTVDLSEGGQKTLNTKNIIVATGSEVIGLPFLPVRNQTLRCYCPFPL